MAYEPLKLFSPGELAVERRDTGEISVRLPTGTYDFVKAFATHPITDPRRHVVLRGTPTGGKETELGVVPDLDLLAPEPRQMIEEALARRYRMATISKILAARDEFGYLYLDVETDRGRREITFWRWDQKTVIETGAHGEGRIIFDLFGNRSLIPDLDRLDPRSRALFDRFIFW